MRENGERHTERCLAGEVPDRPRRQLLRDPLAIRALIRPAKHDKDVVRLLQQLLQSRDVFFNRILAIRLAGADTESDADGVLRHIVQQAARDERIVEVVPELDAVVADIEAEVDERVQRALDFMRERLRCDDGMRQQALPLFLDNAFRQIVLDGRVTDRDTLLCAAEIREQVIRALLAAPLQANRHREMHVPQRIRREADQLRCVLLRRRRHVDVDRDHAIHVRAELRHLSDIRLREQRDERLRISAAQLAVKWRVQDVVAHRAQLDEQDPLLPCDVPIRAISLCAEHGLHRIHQRLRSHVSLELAPRQPAPCAGPFVHIHPPFASTIVSKKMRRAVFPARRIISANRR